MEHASYAEPITLTRQDDTAEEITLAEDSDSTDTSSWEKTHQIQFIVVMVICAFYLIIILLLAFSHRTYQSARLGWKQRQATAARPGRAPPHAGPAGGRWRPAVHRSSATRLDMPGVFSAENMDRLHKLGEMPQLPAHFVPRFRFTSRGIY